MSDEETQKLVYLTREQILERYGFDPDPFVERAEAGGNFIFNKLVPVDGQLLRVFLERDAAAHPSARKP